MITQSRRIGNFQGTDAAYREYLEQLVFSLQQQVCRLKEQCQAVNQIETGGCSSGNLIIQFENPEVDQTSTASTETSKAAVNEFSRLVPRNKDDWLAKRQNVGFDKAEHVLRTFYLLTRRSQPAFSLDIGKSPDDKASILSVLADYRVFATELEAHKVYATQISNYSTLVFICLCIIALHHIAFRDETKRAAVNDEMRKFLGCQQGKECTAGKQYLGQLRTAALWPIRCMDELCGTDLQHLGAELFVLCGPSIHSYRKFTQVEREKLVSEMKGWEPDESFIPDETQGFVSFHITFLIKIMLSERYSLQQINEALGTSVSQERFDKWDSALQRIRSIVGEQCNGEVDDQPGEGETTDAQVVQASMLKQQARNQRKRAGSDGTAPRKRCPIATRNAEGTRKMLADEVDSTLGASVEGSGASTPVPPSSDGDTRSLGHDLDLEGLGGDCDPGDALLALGSDPLRENGMADSPPSSRSEDTFMYTRMVMDNEDTANLNNFLRIF